MENVLKRLFHAAANFAMYNSNSKCPQISSYVYNQVLNKIKIAARILSQKGHTGI